MNPTQKNIINDYQSYWQGFEYDCDDIQLSAKEMWHYEILPLIYRSPFWQQHHQMSAQTQLMDFDITDYSDYRLWLEMAYDEYIQPFNGEVIDYWTETTGTTGPRKYFPISASFRAQYLRTVKTFNANLFQKFPKLFEHKLCCLAAWSTNKKTSTGVPMGRITRFNYEQLSDHEMQLQAIPKAILHDKALYQAWAPLYALANDLSGFFSVDPGYILKFIKTCQTRLTELLPYLLGEVSLPDTLPPLSIDPKRRQVLEKIANRESVEVTVIWPNLMVISCWTQGPCRQMAQQLSELVGASVTVFDGIYSATEAWLAVPISHHHTGGVLHPEALITEFIEVGKPIDKAHLVSAWQLKVGTQYEVFVTTGMGLVRYRMRDVVVCTGFYKESPILSFCHKVNQLKLLKCALPEQDLVEVVNAVCPEFKSHWRFAINSSCNRVCLVVDSDAQIGSEILAALHQGLIERNDKYRFEVNQGNIFPPSIVRTSHAELKREGHAQSKPTYITQKQYV